MVNRNFQNELLSPQEEQLGQRLAELTRTSLPLELAARLEQQIAAAEPKVVPLRRPQTNWRVIATLAAVIVLLIIAAIVIPLLLPDGKGKVSAADIERKVDQASREKLQPGSLVHRKYDIISRSPTSTIAIGTQEDWVEVAEAGQVTFYKYTQKVQSEILGDKPVQANVLIDASTGNVDTWLVGTDVISRTSIQNYKPNINPLADAKQLQNYSARTFYGSISVIRSEVSEPDADTYLISYFYELENKEIGRKGYLRQDFYISKKSYEVERLVYDALKSRDGPSLGYRDEFSITFAEILPPDPARNRELVKLGAPPDAKIVDLLKERP